jgi:hypothetical protein
VSRTSFVDESEGELRLRAAEIRREDLEREGSVAYRTNPTLFSSTPFQQSATAAFTNRFRQFTEETLARYIVNEDRNQAKHPYAAQLTPSGLPAA